MPLCPSTTFLLPDRNYIVVANAGARPTGASLFAGLRIYQSDIFTELLYDGSNWIRMSEPAQGFTPTVTSTGGTITTLGSVSLVYARSNGFLDFYGNIAITTSGTATGGLSFTLPVNPSASSGTMMGTARESNITGTQGSVFISGTSGQIVSYSNGWIGGNGYNINFVGRYRMTSRYS